MPRQTSTTYEVDKSYLITKPKPRGLDATANSAKLVAGRYGTDSTVDRWGQEATYAYCLKSQATAQKVLSRWHPDIVPPEHADVLIKTASLEYIDPQRIRQLEEKFEHDVIAINAAWEEAVTGICPDAAAHINEGRTSADTTETAKALQIKDTVEIIADSLENLRDILLEKAMSWKDVPHMDQTHRYDALPTYAGRPLVHYAEMLQSDIDLFYTFYNTSLVGKWGDATGNHHSLDALGADGIEMQREYCGELGLKFMDAAAQVPGREFTTDFVYAMARTADTMANLATYIATGRGDDVNIFINTRPGKPKGSSAMPHKDAKNGNPSKEEQTVSFANYASGAVVTALRSDMITYARDLSGSASDRVTLETLFKWGDEVIRNLAKTVYYTDLRIPRSVERVKRSFGVVTSAQVMTYLTDHRKTSKPLPRSKAHDLMGELAQRAWDEEQPFLDVLLECNEVTSRLDENMIREISDPLKYVGQSGKIIEAVYQKYHGNHKFLKSVP